MAQIVTSLNGGDRLNITFLILAAALIWRFFTKGGLTMLRMMNKPAAMDHAH